jgi:alpha-mannosidase
VVFGDLYKGHKYNNNNISNAILYFVGHQWVKNNLGVTPKTGWSIDPFGHGATVPYLLRASGLNATIIQRVHYAWKQWLAQKQMGDFIWRQSWASDKTAHQTDMLTHNQPFDIYSIKHSCGPHPQVCLNFDFRKVPGEYTDYSVKAVPIDDRNVRDKADLLLAQYGRTASLFPHNVVLMPIGDDFRFDHDIEWDQQYTNYKKIFDYINQNPTRYQNAEVSFGTPADYFAAVRERMTLATEAGNTLGGGFRTLRGDFFVYSDIFSEGRPAYWSGYFTTRPYWKQLDRDLEASLRTAEILYTVALGRARQHGANRTAQLLERDFEKLVKARRNLGLFQHHDAITGTSKAFVMHDYALKMFEGLQDTVSIQSRCAHALLLPPSGGFDTVNNEASHPGSFPSSSHKLGGALLTDTDRESYDQLPRKVPVVVPINEPRRIVLFNPLAQHRQDVARIRLTSPDVQVRDATSGALIPFQVNPVWNNTILVHGQFEVIWVADLPPLTLVTYILERIADHSNILSRAIVYCSECMKTPQASVAPTGTDPPTFNIRSMQAGDIQLENHKLKLLFDGRTGFLKAITRKTTGRTTQCALQIAAYPSAQFHSGAYLFMPDPNSREPEKEILQDDSQEIVITSGPISSEIIVSYGKLFVMTVRVYHAAGALSEGVQMETIVDFDAPPKNRETELFMRFVTDISNGQGADGSVPEFYTDQNGFQMQRRIKVERIGIEGNYFPVTSMTYLQVK